MDIQYLPVGSVVLLEGGTKTLVVVGRALNVKQNDNVVFFDYAGAPYPEGLTGQDVVYFNADGIAQVVFEGYRDDADKALVNEINRYIKIHGVTRAEL